MNCSKMGTASAADRWSNFITYEAITSPVGSSSGLCAKNTPSLRGFLPPTVLITLIAQGFFWPSVLAKGALISCCSLAILKLSSFRFFS